VKRTSPLSPIASVLPSRSMGTWPGIAQLSGFTLAKKTFANISKMVEAYVDEHKVSIKRHYQFFTNEFFPKFVKRGCPENIFRNKF